MRKLLLAGATVMMLAAQAPRFRPVFSSGPRPIGPYSPGLWAGDRLYVSGQGSRDASNQLPATPEAQVRQTLDNVKAIVEAAGLTMDHVVFSHTYLADMKHYELLNKVWNEYFPTHKPARATIGVAAMPGGTPFEINAIAVRDRAGLKAVQLPGATSPVPLSPGIQTSDRVYVSGILGRDASTGVMPAELPAQVETAFSRLKGVLGSAGLDYRHLIHLNVYTTAAMPDDTVSAALRKYIPNRDNVAISATRAASLPFGANVSFYGVATRTLAPRQRHGNCVGAGGTVYCGQFTSDDYRTALIGLNGLLQEFTPRPTIVASGVYLDDLKEFTAMNKVYTEVMGAPLPTRTTVQPAAVGESARFRIAVVAER
jgi:2-iminobutanoate/2-iminopropanoate deaminase